MIDAERINSQLSHVNFKRFNLFFLHVGIKTVYIAVYNQHKRGSTVSVHEKAITSACEKVIAPVHEKVITSACEKLITSACEKVIASACEKVITSACEKAIASVDPWGGRLMIDKERINSQLSV